MKNKSKILKLVGLLLLTSVFLTACAVQPSAHGAPTAPTSGPYSWIYNLFGHPIQNIMLFVENKIGGTNGAGWAIALITFVVQLIVMPLRLSSSYKATKQQEKMQRAQPQVDLIQKAMKEPGLSKDHQMQISQLQMKLYKANNLSLTGGMGCLPLLIQLPIMMGIYQAVAYSKDLAEASFYGISLGQRSIVLTIIATLLYLVQGYLSLIGISEQQKKAMKMTLIISPLMTFFISMSSSGALALYFLVGGIVIVIQQIITTFVLMPKVKKEVEAELSDTPFKVVVTPEVINNIINDGKTDNDQPSENEKNTHKELRQRNSGKQNRKNK